MNYQRFHDLTFDVLYACIIVLVYVILERGSYLTYLSWRMNRLAKIIDGSTDHGAEALAALKWKDPASRAVQRYARLIADGASRERQEDYSSALFIGLDKNCSACSGRFSASWKLSTRSQRVGYPTPPR